MDKQIMVHLYSGMLFNNKKEYTINSRKTLDGFQRPYAEWKKRGSKYDNIIWFHLSHILQKAELYWWRRDLW